MRTTIKHAGGSSYAEALRIKAAAPQVVKSSRTRLRLLAALADQLAAADEASPPRVTDIANQAGVAHATFYRYFTDQDEALEELVSGFLTHLAETQHAARQGAPGSPERIHQSIVTYAEMFRENVGLMRRLMSTNVGAGASRERFHAFNREWYLRVAEAIWSRKQGAEGGGESFADLVPIAYALGGMVDEFLAQIYIRRDPNLAFLAHDVDAIGRHLTRAWCFGAYGEPQATPLRASARAAAGT